MVLPYLLDVAFAFLNQLADWDVYFVFSLRSIVDLLKVVVPKCLRQMSNM